jgi:hypothetical protein
VVVHISDDVIVASVLDHGPDLPARPPTDADTDALGVRSRGLWLLRRLVDEMRLGSGASTITSNGAAGPQRTKRLLYGYSSVNSMLGFSARASRACQPSRG